MRINNKAWNTAEVEHFFSKNFTKNTHLRTATISCITDATFKVSPNYQISLTRTPSANLSKSRDCEFPGNNNRYDLDTRLQVSEAHCVVTT